MLIALPHILGCELAFLREDRYLVKPSRQVIGVFVFREKSDALYAGSLAVARECRKHSMATYILGHCTDVAKRLRKKWLELTVLKTNIPARQLY
jgi:ribosomal protein S18 acetylase RimI-like enzyme